MAKVVERAGEEVTVAVTVRLSGITVTLYYLH